MTNTTTPTRATAFAGVVVFGVQKTISMSRRYDNDWKKISADTMRFGNQAWIFDILYDK